MTSDDGFFDHLFRPRHDRHSTAPLPVISDTRPIERTPPPTDEERAEAQQLHGYLPELADATIPGPIAEIHHGDGYYEPMWNWQVGRALERICDLVDRGRPDAEIVRRCAVILRADPAIPATPFRCANYDAEVPGCHGIYAGMDGEPDWRIAGREDALCVPCALKAPRHAAKPKAAQTGPAKARQTAARRRPSAARKNLGAKP